MTTREKFRAVLNGDPPDSPLWIPRIDLWYNARVRQNNLPEEWKGYSLRQVESELFGATSARAGKVFQVVYNNVDIETINSGDRETTTYTTPVGTVSRTESITDDLRQSGLPGRVVKELLQTPADYKVWEYIVENTEWIPAYDEFEKYATNIGEDGLPMVAVGDVPFHEFALRLAGYNDVFYQLADYSDDIRSLLRITQEVEKERKWPVVADSPAALLLWGVHLSSQFTPPPVFEQYILRYSKEVLQLLHESGKKVAMHADNDTSQIAVLLEQAGWDMLECFVTEPMVPMTLERAAEVWEDRIIIWGGIPSAILAPSYPLDKFKRYIEKAIAHAGDGHALILGVADNVMPDSDISRVKWISACVESL